MATEDSPRESFRDIDWDQEAGRQATLGSPRALLQALSFAALILAFFYDLMVLIEDETLIGSWNVSSVEWLFMGVLLLGLYNIAWPLYENKRMTAYYWRQFRKNKVAVASLGFLSVIFVVGLIGPMVIEPPT
ncbi:MAG: ABC transporter permease, partial [Halobacteriaceae archaeon]